MSEYKDINFHSLPFNYHANELYLSEKSMKYLPAPFRIIKDNLFEMPPIFQLIQQNSGADDKEMYQVFNMGHRLEIFTNETAAAKMIAVAQQFNIEAKIVGRVEAADYKELVLKGSFGEIRY